MDDNEPNVCRICQEEDDKKLIAPCRCNGTVKYIHEECFKKWIETSKNNTTCPTCGGPYNEEFIVNIDSSVYRPEKSIDFMKILCQELVKTMMQLTTIFVLVILLFEGKLAFSRACFIILPLFIIFKIIDITGRYRNGRL